MAEELTLLKQDAATFADGRVAAFDLGVQISSSARIEADGYRAKWVAAEEQVAALKKELDAAHGKATAMVAERDAAQKLVCEQFEALKAMKADRDALKSDFDAELAGAKSLREQYGARENETMFDFIARLYSGSCERDALKEALERAQDQLALGGEPALMREATLEIIRAALAPVAKED